MRVIVVSAFLIVAVAVAFSAACVLTLRMLADSTVVSWRVVATFVSVSVILGTGLGFGILQYWGLRSSRRLHAMLLRQTREEALAARYEPIQSNLEAVTRCPSGANPHPSSPLSGVHTGGADVNEMTYAGSTYSE